MSVSITHVEVEPDGEGGLAVRWQTAEAAAVDVSVGSTPVAIEHRQALRVPAGTQSARLTGLAPGHRHYVSVAPLGSGKAVVAGERRVPLEGAVNFRDLGGYPTLDGTWTKWGRIFRSDGLHRLTETDLETLSRLGIRAVYDLRGDNERANEPDLVASVQLALLAWYTRGNILPASPIEAERALYEIYIGMLVNSAQLFGRLFSGLLSRDGLPALFHCTGGKDRSGLTAALLLSALDVDRETVLDDYVLTARWLNPDHDKNYLNALVSAGMTPDAARAFLGAPRWVMADALSWLDENYGGVEPYILGPAGMEKSDISQLRDALTD